MQIVLIGNRETDTILGELHFDDQKRSLRVVGCRRLIDQIRQHQDLHPVHPPHASKWGLWVSSFISKNPIDRHRLIPVFESGLFPCPTPVGVEVMELR